MDYTYFPYAKRCKIESPNEWERPPSTHALGGSEVDRGAMRPGSGTDIPQSEPAPTGHQYLPFHPAAPGNMFSSSPATPTLPHHNLGLTSATTPPIPHPPFPVNPLAPAAETKPFDQCMYNMHNFNGSSYCDPNYSSSMFSMPMYGGAPQWAAQRCDTGNVACAYGQNSFYDYRNMGHMANTDSQNMYFQQTGHPYMSRAMFEPVIKREADCTNIPPDRGRGPDNGAYSFSPTQHGMSPHAMTQHAALNQYHMAPQMHNIKSERMPMGYPHNQVSPHQSQSPNSMAETCVYHSLLEGDADADENPDRKTIYNFSCSDQANMADQYLLLEQQLCFRLRSLLFPEPVSHIYCPLDHAFEPHADYVRKYYHGRKEVMFLGMNPGPFGMVQNGVPFGEVEIVKDWLKVSGNVFKPRREHPQRPVLGMECKRSEVSGARFWGLLREICGDPETFFTHCFIHNHCPLAFMSVTGKNITPPKLPVGVRKALNEACDQALKEAMRLYGVKILVGVGKFAQERAKAVLNGEEWSSIRIETIMHPSPINPAANKGWNDIAKQQLRDIGVWQYLTPKSPCPAAPTDAPTNPAISAAPVPTSTPPAAPSLPNTPTLPSTPIPNTPPTNPPSLPPQC